MVSEHHKHWCKFLEFDPYFPIPPPNPWRHLKHAHEYWRKFLDGIVSNSGYARVEGRGEVQAYLGDHRKLFCSHPPPATLSALSSQGLTVARSSMVLRAFVSRGARR